MATELLYLCPDTYHTLVHLIRLCFRTLIFLLLKPTWWMMMIISIRLSSLFSIPFSQPSSFSTFFTFFSLEHALDLELVASSHALPRPPLTAQRNSLTCHLGDAWTPGHVRVPLLDVTPPRTTYPNIPRLFPYPPYPPYPHIHISV